MPIMGDQMVIRYVKHPGFTGHRSIRSLAFQKSAAGRKNILFNRFAERFDIVICQGSNP